MFKMRVAVLDNDTRELRGVVLRTIETTDAPAAIVSAARWESRGLESSSSFRYITGGWRFD